MTNVKYSKFASNCPLGIIDQFEGDELTELEDRVQRLPDNCKKFNSDKKKIGALHAIQKPDDLPEEVREEAIHYVENETGINVTPDMNKLLFEGNVHLINNEKVNGEKFTKVLFYLSERLINSFKSANTHIKTLLNEIKGKIDFIFLPEEFHRNSFRISDKRAPILDPDNRNLPIIHQDAIFINQLNFQDMGPYSLVYYPLCQDPELTRIEKAIGMVQDFGLLASNKPVFILPSFMQKSFHPTIRMKPNNGSGYFTVITPFMASILDILEFDYVKGNNNEIKQLTGKESKDSDRLFDYSYIELNLSEKNIKRLIKLFEDHGYYTKPSKEEAVEKLYGIHFDTLFFAIESILQALHMSLETYSSYVTIVDKNGVPLKDYLSPKNIKYFEEKSASNQYILLK